jgi:hypothetical protein
MAKYECPNCGHKMHLGRCDDAGETLNQSTNYHVGWHGGYAVLDDTGKTVASGFDTKAEAEEWIDERTS